MKVAIVTPTIGNKVLEDCLRSVEEQTYKNLTHYIFVDGIENYKTVSGLLEGASKVKTIALEENVGKGWYGHRVYAASSFLVNADVICYLDEDNWLEPNHVESIVQKLHNGVDWVYSLRNVVDKDGNFICQDNCESLGKWSAYFNDDVHHIDTSCFAVRRDVAVRIGHSWYGQWGADRQFYQNLSKYFPKYECTGQYTLNYRLDGNENSVKKEFFQKGNEVMKSRYGENYPWLKNELPSLRVGPGISVVM